MIICYHTIGIVPSSILTSTRCELNPKHMLTNLTLKWYRRIIVILNRKRRRRKAPRNTQSLPLLATVSVKASQSATESRGPSHRFALSQRFKSRASRLHPAFRKQSGWKTNLKHYDDMFLLFPFSMRRHNEKAVTYLELLYLRLQLAPFICSHGTGNDRSGDPACSTKWLFWRHKHIGHILPFHPTFELGSTCCEKVRRMQI